ncbi:MAG: histidine phosphatase family protein [Elusimicrobia bacterium]|nr:histidine phosphatase family protein [Elusimicrobiota bacterium]
MAERRQVAGFVGAVAAVWLFAWPADAAPAQVIIIRHGEKPAVGSHLCPRGVCRADALAAVFPRQFGTPAAIYAMKPSSEEGSMRAIETVTPLARALNLTINTSYTRKQLQPLVDDIMKNPACQGQMVLISWEHKVIPALVQTFCAGGAASGACDPVPVKWPGSVFDQAWILNFNGVQVSSFKVIPEKIGPDVLNGNCPLADVLPPNSPTPAPEPCASAAEGE